jgi:hypothetical protein
MHMLTAMALAILVGALAGLLTKRIPLHRVCGLLGVSNGLISIQSIREGHVLVALLHGAVCAGCFYAWWHGGGGDDTRRKLRQFRRRFEGVRRTAPTAA